MDFIPIISTDSPDDAVALLIAMYTIFELVFDKKSRAIRLLYSILHGDKRFLSNSIRILIKEKNIDIYYEQQLISSASSNSSLNNSTTTSTTQSQTPINSSRDFVVEDERSTAAQAIQESFDNHSDMAASSGVDFQNKRKRKRKNVNSEDENMIMLNAVEKQNECLTLHKAALNDTTNTVNTRQSKKKRN